MCDSIGNWLHQALIVTLMTTICWRHYDDDEFWMLVAEWLFWWLYFVKIVICPMLMIGHQNRRSESCHQRKRSSASVPNIDVTAANCPSHQVVVARKLFIKASGWWQQASDSWMLLASNNNQICQQKKVIVVNIHVVCW